MVLAECHLDLNIQGWHSWAIANLMTSSISCTRIKQLDLTFYFHSHDRWEKDIQSLEEFIGRLHMLETFTGLGLSKEGLLSICSALAHLPKLVNCHLNCCDVDGVIILSSQADASAM
jgi:hypothetical protein